MVYEGAILECLGARYKVLSYDPFTKTVMLNKEGEGGYHYGPHPLSWFRIIETGEPKSPSASEEGWE